MDTGTFDTVEFQNFVESKFKFSYDFLEEKKYRNLPLNLSTAKFASLHLTGSPVKIPSGKV